MQHVIWSSCTCENVHIDPQVEWRPSLAQNVRSHLVKQKIWVGTWSPELGKKHTSVQNAEICLRKLEIWNDISLTPPEGPVRRQKSSLPQEGQLGTWETPTIITSSRRSFGTPRENIQSELSAWGAMRDFENCILAPWSCCQACRPWAGFGLVMMMMTEGVGVSAP